MAVVSEGSTQETGDVYAMNFVYSGNFVSFVEKAQFGTQRFGMGKGISDLFKGRRNRTESDRGGYCDPL